MIILKKIILLMLLNSYIFSAKSETNIFCPIASNKENQIKNFKEQSKISEFITAIRKSYLNLIKTINMPTNKSPKEDFIIAKYLSGANELRMAENGYSK